MYEILKTLKKESRYLEINNKILLIRAIGTGLSLVVGYYLANFSWAYVYIPLAFIFFISTIPLFFLKEPRASFNKVDKNSTGSVIKKIKNELLYPFITVFILFIYLQAVFFYSVVV